MKYNYSVIVPYHDRYELFRKAVSSVPDRDDIQVIIVDNAKESLQPRQIPLKKKSLVSYIISSPTKGAGCARNEGLKIVEGKYILFLDADDYFLPEAFSIFDKYLDKCYDIVYFNTDSIRLLDGVKSNRHINISSQIFSFLDDKNEDHLRYCIFNPIAKLFYAKFISDNRLLFEEIRVSNDVWFSVMSGHLAKSLTADKAIVYMITEGEVGSSLTKVVNKDNMFIRFEVLVRYNRFMRSIAKPQYHVRLLGPLKIALKYFGIREFFRYFFYLCKI